MAWNPIVGDFIKLSWSCKLGSQYAVLSRKYRVVSTTGTAATSTEILTQMSNDMGSALRDAMSQDASYEAAKLESVPTSSHAFETTVSGAGAGAVASDAMAGQTSGVVRLLAASGGRKGRGRTFVPYPAELHNTTNGVPTAGYLVLLAAVGTFMVGNQVITGAAGTLTMEAVLTNAPTLPTLTFPIVQQTTRSQWGTQRRRSAINRGDAPPF